MAACSTLRCSTSVAFPSPATGGSPRSSLGRVLAERALVLAGAGRLDEAAEAAAEATALAGELPFDGYRDTLRRVAELLRVDPPRRRCEMPTFRPRRPAGRPRSSRGSCCTTRRAFPSGGPARPASRRAATTRSRATWKRRPTSPTRRRSRGTADGSRIVVSCLLSNIVHEWSLTPAPEGCVVHVRVELPEAEAHRLDAVRAEVIPSLQRLVELADRGSRASAATSASTDPTASPARVDGRDGKRGARPARRRPWESCATSPDHARRRPGRTR